MGQRARPGPGPLHRFQFSVFPIPPTKDTPAVPPVRIHFSPRRRPPSLPRGFTLCRGGLAWGSEPASARVHSIVSSSQSSLARQPKIHPHLTTYPSPQVPTVVPPPWNLHAPFFSVLYTQPRPRLPLDLGRGFVRLRPHLHRPSGLTSAALEPKGPFTLALLATLPPTFQPASHYRALPEGTLQRTHARWTSPPRHPAAVRSTPGVRSRFTVPPAAQKTPSPALPFFVPPAPPQPWRRRARKENNYTPPAPCPVGQGGRASLWGAVGGPMPQCLFLPPGWPEVTAEPESPATRSSRRHQASLKPPGESDATYLGRCSCGRAAPGSRRCPAKPKEIPCFFISLLVY